MGPEQGEPYVASTSGYVFCRLCGRGFKKRGIKLHMARAHLTKMDDSSSEHEYFDPDCVALRGGETYKYSENNFILFKTFSGFQPDVLMLPPEVTLSEVPMAQNPTSRNVTYKELIELMKKNEALIIDVRERSEIRQTGAIPNSVNIPRMELRGALTELTNTEFRRKYGFPIPNKDIKLVFSCQSGGRSKAAMDLAVSLGFSNSYNYPGGYSEWEQHNRRT